MLRFASRLLARPEGRMLPPRDVAHYLLDQGGTKMLWTITVILLVLWVLGLVSGASMGAWVHILLVLAVVSLIFAVLRRGSAVV